MIKNNNYIKPVEMKYTSAEASIQDSLPSQSILLEGNVNDKIQYIDES